MVDVQGVNASRKHTARNMASAFSQMPIVTLWQSRTQSMPIRRLGAGHAQHTLGTRWWLSSID
jgi:hypothetical protein